MAAHLGASEGGARDQREAAHRGGEGPAENSARMRENAFIEQASKGRAGEGGTGRARRGCLDPACVVEVCLPDMMFEDDLIERCEFS